MNGRELVIGVSGGIAAYKSAQLVSRLVQAGAGVVVVMTRAAQRFVAPATFQALSGRPVARDLFDPNRQSLGAHVELAEQADLLCVAPATANILAKAAVGLADDLLSTLILSFAGPILLAPAMNDRMWNKPSVARNLNTLKADGFHIIDPVSGWLSCRHHGVGRMAEPEAIVEAIARLLG
ncbi:MAG: phosphopantothenoylcysteine decarboxylase [Planctomycetes bacterium RBG_16_64_10]|nr:MAG: phosphopantothenoylcysteine decarboxylase [Planctomycetes bacterium RBG_16_64_10]